MRVALSLATAALLAAMPLSTEAQPKPSDDHGAHPSGGMGMMGSGDMSRMMAMTHGGMMMDGMPYRHIEGRLAFLKAELKITPEQEPQWTKFAEAVRATTKSASDGMRSMMMGGGMMHGPAPTALDVMNRYEKTLTIRLDALRTVKAAFEPLYAALSDEQKKTANELLASPMGVM